MICPRCGRPLVSSVCPSCGWRAAPHTSHDEPEVLEPELMEPGQSQSSERASSRFDRNNGHTHVVHIFGSSFSGGAGLPLGCLPGVITLILIMATALQFGILAAIGFTVFVGVGRAVTFYLGIQQALKGRPVHPWLGHIVTWAICWLLVAWLSGALT